MFEVGSVFIFGEFDLFIVILCVVLTDIADWVFHNK